MTLESGYRRAHPTAPSPWRTAFKWISGIVFTLVLILFLTVLTIFQANSPSHSPATINALIVPLLSDPELAAGIYEVDPELLDYLESPSFATSVYEDPGAFQQEIDSLPEVSSGSYEQLNATLDTISVAAVLLGQPVHAGFGMALAVLGFLLVASGAVLVLMSRRLGRLANPGICVAVASWLPLLAIAITRSRLQDYILHDIGTSTQTTLRTTIKLLAESLLDRGVGVFGWASFLAVLLLIGAGAGLLAVRMRGH